MLTITRPDSRFLKSVLCSLLLCASALATTPAQADEAAAPQFDVNRSSADNLLQFRGKAVDITMTSGQIVTGSVKDVKNGMLHLERLSQKEYYDAVIMLDQICAITVRVGTTR